MRLQESFPKRSVPAVGGQHPGGSPKASENMADAIQASLRCGACERALPLALRSPPPDPLQVMFDAGLMDRRMALVCRVYWTQHDCPGIPEPYASDISRRDRINLGFQGAMSPGGDVGGSAPDRPPRRRPTWHTPKHGPTQQTRRVGTSRRQGNARITHNSMLFS